MRKHLIGIALTILALAGRAAAGTVFGALSNFDAVNDTGSPCNGFEIELDDIQSQDVTYTFQFQRYGVPKITEDLSDPLHPRTFVRWMSPYDQTAHVFTQTTPMAAAGFQNTGGHQCYRGMLVGSIPYDAAGCEHFGVGTLKNPSNAVYRWMKEDPTAPGSLIAQGNPVSIPAPVWTVPAGANPVVVAVIPVPPPPPPALVPVPYRPDAEFGVAVWAKVFETESPNKAELEHLVADDKAVPGNLGPEPNPNTVPEIEWQILQTDAMNPSVNELRSERQMGGGNESVTRRYEFYKYMGPYDINSSDGPDTGTNEALCASVGPDGLHGGAGSATIYDVNGVATIKDCSTWIVVGAYIGAQMAAANVATPLSANDATLVDGEVGVQYPNRPLIFGGNGGPYSIAFTGGTLPATDAGNAFTLDASTGVLKGGIPNGTGTATFTVHATDLVDPSQKAVDATFNITVVDAVTVDSIVIPDGTPNVTTSVDLTASGGETPFRWTVSPSFGLQASVLGNTLSLTANGVSTFTVQATVTDSLGGTNTKTLTYKTAYGFPTPTPTPTPSGTGPTPTPTPTTTGTPPTLAPTFTPTPTGVLPTINYTLVPTPTPSPTRTTTGALPTFTETFAPTPTPTPTGTPPTLAPTFTPTPTGVLPTFTHTFAPTPTLTPTPTPTLTPTWTPTGALPTFTETFAPTFTPTPTGVLPTFTHTFAPTPTPSPTRTTTGAVPTFTETFAPTPTPTPMTTGTPPTLAPTFTPTPTATPTGTSTAIGTSTPTAIGTRPSFTPTSTPPPTAPPTATPTGTSTAIGTRTPTAIGTRPSFTPTSTPPPTATPPRTSTAIGTSTPLPTATVTHGAVSWWEDGGCQIGSRPGHGAPWLLLIPVAALMWRRTTRRRTPVRRG